MRADAHAVDACGHLHAEQLARDRLLVHVRVPEDARGEQRANRVERQALELAEAVVLSGREGDTFPAVVIDEGEQGVDFQVTEPAVLGRVSARHVDPGDEIRVRVVSVDVENAQVVYERVA